MTNNYLNILRRFWFFPLAAVAVGAILVSPVFSQPQALTGGLPGVERIHNKDTLTISYMNRDMRPIWVRGNGSFQPRVAGIIEILEESWTHGLNPERYHIEDIKTLLANINDENRLELDILVSDSVLHYTHDLTGMRGASQSADKMVKYWREPVESSALLQKLSDAGDPVSLIRDLEPAHNLYAVLRKELIELAALPDDTNGKAIKIGKAIKPGKSAAQIPAIRERLGVPAVDTNSELYDEALAVAVMKLQKDYGLDTDGVINARVMKVINRTNHDKMMQIVANMERLRWISEGRPDRYILVNIPSANLWAVEKGDVKLEMPVIVGKTARPTYSFKTEITGVRFNPNWTVPPTIKRDDFLPALQQDPYALTKKGIKLAVAGKEIDPGKVDWTKVSNKDLHQVHMTQSPGDNNPLGKIRVIMENPYNIYLHDTNHRELFDGKERNLSSGCIRVSKPEELANFIMSKNQDWTEEGMRKLISSGRMRDVPTESSIPVFITYQTVWLNSEGKLVYGEDVYGQDRKLADILKAAKAINIPKAQSAPEISL